MSHTIEHNDKILELLQKVFDNHITEYIPVVGGNIKNVYFFRHRNKDYVLSVFTEHTNNMHNKYLNRRLIQNNIGVKQLISSGYDEGCYYEIHTKLVGDPYRRNDNLNRLIPQLFRNLVTIHRVDVSDSTGYGWIKHNGQGTYPSFNAFLEGFFQEVQNGFWENWYDLFMGDMLNKDIFYGFYDRMMMLSKFCEGKRYLVHGDFHLGNVIGIHGKITGIIDWDNALYGDYVYDISTLQMTLPNYPIYDMFHSNYVDSKIDTHCFLERFTCLSILRGLDALRFYAKKNKKCAYESVIRYLKLL
ncbi:aminoglycoside phosphotransferase family protein [Vallitalea pronyensis]|uniref:Aminoglycoside phosphotransferase family protein n=1 Tax=Vallitalea pronyensis TaxID=1348613 RepID=A0A8J8SGB5_9FIRM|nr:aminoglycoside phosphotransferase family protein [Vallitalea pronyensis]QUI22600.1 aminoglycoside phosphotransferase family protein [Vallitalea pronyensis]